MRPIDADVLKEVLLAGIADESGFYADLTRKLITAFVDEQPTIDPGKHGRWEHRMLTSYPAKAICVCNLCGQVMDREYFYCPHCGAKMERSEDG